MQTCEELLAENAALRARVAEVEAENAALKAQLAAALARIAALEARLGMNSRNSSRPPSSDPPSAPPRKKRPSGRKRGGQPGHKGRTRSLLPPEEVDEVIEVRPEKCERCGEALSGEDPSPSRRQVVDVPPV